MFVQQRSVENKSTGYKDSSWNGEMSKELKRKAAEFTHVTRYKSGRGVSSNLADHKVCDTPVAGSW